MPRSVNAVASRRRRKKILKQTKGNFLARRNVYTVAKNTLEKGWQHAYRDRKRKKGEFRALWIQRINAAVREEGMTYSEFIGVQGHRAVGEVGLPRGRRYRVVCGIPGLWAQGSRFSVGSGRSALQASRDWGRDAARVGYGLIFHNNLRLV